MVHISSKDGLINSIGLVLGQFLRNTFKLRPLSLIVINLWMLLKIHVEISKPFHKTSTHPPPSYQKENKWITIEGKNTQTQIFIVGKNSKCSGLSPPLALYTQSIELVY